MMPHHPPGAASFKALAYALSVLIPGSCTLTAVEPAGFNFYGSRAGNGALAPEETAFGLPGSHWANVQFSFEGNPSASTNTGTKEVTLNGATYTLSWETGSLFSGQISAPATPEERVLTYYARNHAGGSPRARITISGLSAAQPEGFTVRVIAANRDGSAFHPIGITAGGAAESLAFINLGNITPAAAWPDAGFAVSATSATLTGDSVEVLAGADADGMVNGISAILIEPPGLPIQLNAFNADTEIPQWDEGAPLPEGAWESVPTGAVSAIQPRALSLSYDPGKDAANDPTNPELINPNSGALKVSADFTIAGAGTVHEWRILRHFPGGKAYDLTAYEKFSFDVYFDPASSGRAGGYGFFECWALLAPAEEGGEPEWIKLPKTADGEETDQAPGSASTKWVRMEAAVPPGDPRFRQVLGLAVSGAHRAGGTATLWIDNLGLARPTAVAEPPVLAIEPASPGLLLVGNGDWNRQSIRTVGNGHAWRGVATPSNPVSYSFTLPRLPGAADMQTHLFLVPDLGEDPPPVINNQPDWSRPVCARLVIYNNAAGGAFAAIDYKTSGAESNGSPTAYNSPDDGLNGGTLATLEAPSYAGVWTLTWTSDTEFTLTAPSYVQDGQTMDGPSVSGALTAEASERFSGGLFAYFGMMPNGASRVGHPLWISNISITGVPTPAVADFTTALDPAVWGLIGAYPDGVVPVTADTAPLWLTWSESQGRGFTLRQSADLQAWEDAATSASLVLDGQRRALSNAAARPDGGQGFFRLERP